MSSLVTPHEGRARVAPAPRSSLDQAVRKWSDRRWTTGDQAGPIAITGEEVPEVVDIDLLITEAMAR
jgi:hypothetical protein